MKDVIRAQAFDCMQYLYREAQEPLIRCCVRFAGRLDETALYRAAALAAALFPLAACTFDKRKRLWRRGAFTACDMVRYFELPGGESDAAPFLLSSIDCEREPQVKLFVLRAPDGDILCVLMNHMIGDGTGFKEYLYLLSELYTNCARDPAYTVEPGPPGQRKLRQILKNLSIREKWDILRAEPQVLGPDPALTVPLQGGAVPFIVVKRINEEPFQRLRGFAKREGVSVNDLLLAAYTRGLNRLTGCGQIALPCPVDLRKYQAPGQSTGICNLTSNYFCRAAVAPGEPFGVTLKKVSDAMCVQKQSNACLQAPMLFHIAFYTLPFGIVRRLFFRFSPIARTSYTNLGVLDGEKFRFGEIRIADAFLSTATKRAPYYQLSVSTYRGRCTLSSTMLGSDKDRAVIDGLLDGIIRELNETVGA